MRSGNTSNWPSTQGTVIYTERKFNDEESAPHIGYSYQVAGRTYYSSRVDFGGLHSNSLLCQFKKNQRVPVYYDQDHPQDSVLIPGYDRGTVAVYGVMGCSIFFVGWRVWFKEKDVEFYDGL